MKQGLLLSVLFSIIFGATTQAQTDTSFLTKAVASITKQEDAAPVEKVYLHLNKSYYTLGDTIWFKAYAVLGGAHKLTGLSGVLYVELINAGDTVVSRRDLQIDAGLANGDFTLADEDIPGNYRIRAYTSYMRNAGTEYFFDQPIRVLGKMATVEPKKTVKADKTPQPIKLQTAVPVAQTELLPEGGDLVVGLRSKVAVKVVGKSGFGENVKGTVVDNDGTEVASFETQHLGMGIFALTPQPGKTYKAKMTNAAGTIYTADLPATHDEGFTLAINPNMGDSVFVKIAANTKLFASRQNTVFYLIAQSAGKVYYTTQGKLESPVFTIRIPKRRFPTGVIGFTLFSATGEPLNERVIFIQNNDQLKLALSADNKTYATRQKIKIDLSASDAENKTAIGSYSVSVTNETKLPVDESAESTIFSNLLLTSDLKGYIELPNYYFNNPTEETQADLDVLMLTQGYHRFEWKKILNDGISTLAFEPQNSLEVVGKITTSSDKPIAGAPVKLVSTKFNLAADTVTDANGHFNFKGVELPDTAKIIVTARNAKGSKNVAIHIDEPTYPEIGKNTLSSYQSENLEPTVSKALDQIALDTLGAIRLKEVKIKGTKKNNAPDTRRTSNLNGVGHADQVLTGSDFVGCINLSDCLMGKLRGVNIIDGKPYSRRAFNSSFSGNTPMAIIIDGMELSSNSLNDVTVDDVLSVEVLTSASYLAIYGSGAGRGAIVITLKQGKDYAFANRYAPGIVTYRFKGYYKAREFYSPKYDSPTVTNSSDTRSTIYWNPYVTAGKDGKASFEYFNADTKGNYRVVVQGIDNNGKLGYQVYHYTVR